MKNEFLDRTKKTAWKEEEDRDDIAFWDQQKEKYFWRRTPHSLKSFENVMKTLIDGDVDIILLNFTIVYYCIMLRQRG